MQKLPIGSTAPRRIVGISSRHNDYLEQPILGKWAAASAGT
jgi:hypothetical protein